jgi:hypothetical protein
MARPREPLLGKYKIRILTDLPATPSDVFRGFPESLHPNPGIILSKNPGSLPNKVYLLNSNNDFRISFDAILVGV